jgi:sugar transferase EpsL
MVKRLVDLLGATLGILLGAPLFLIICALVRLNLGSPIFFDQIRPGLHAKPFRLRKFRTMTQLRDPSGQLLPDETRLTPFGRFLRSTSLDELPELWSILKGDMSLVGPRPLLPEYLSLYSARHARRHKVRPGLTGWAQINGRNALTWNARLELDVWYVEHCSLRLDFQILARTLTTVLSRQGIAAHGKATMPKLDRHYHAGVDE